MEPHRLQYGKSNSAGQMIQELLSEGVLSHSRQPVEQEEALVVVHLSDMDIYTWECGSEEGMRLARVLVEAITAYSGMIVVTNRQRPFSENSGPRRYVLDVLRQRESVVDIAHDEEEDGWEEPMRHIGQTLLAYGINRVRLAGFEYQKENESGCVRETKRRLEAQGYVCVIDEALCG